MIGLFILGLSPDWTSDIAMSDEKTPSSAQESEQSESLASTVISSDRSDFEKVPHGETRGERGHLVIPWDNPEEGIDFETLHNILYYLYTGCVNLHVGARDYPNGVTSHPPGFPPSPCPFTLYKNAKKYCIEPLSEFCLKYLKESLTCYNVVDRLFDDNCELKFHEELLSFYENYLLEHYHEVKEVSDWEGVLEEGLDDPDVLAFHREILIRLMKKLSYHGVA